MSEAIIHEPEVATRHRLVAVRGPRHRPDDKPWHCDCSCGWRSPLMRFAGDAALLGAQHVVDLERFPVTPGKGES
jgi:hypothetical protein